MRVWRAVWVSVVLAIVASCGGGYGTGPDADPDPVPSTSPAIDVNDNSFGPAATTVPAGTTVTWTWRGSNFHDVFFTGTEHSDAKVTGTYARQFSTAGTYDYICNVHGASMSGRVVVQ